MSKQYTEKSRFQSKYGEAGTFVSDSQFLAEQICERIAKKNKTTLTYKFWNLSAWKVIFIKQAVQATRLLKEYDIFVILKALADPRTRRVYSLGAAYALKPILDEIAKSKAILDSITIEKDESVQPAGETKIRGVSPKNNIFNKLDG